MLLVSVSSLLPAGTPTQQQQWRVLFEEKALNDWIDDFTNSNRMYQ